MEAEFEFFDHTTEEQSPQPSGTIICLA